MPMLVPRPPLSLTTATRSSAPAVPSPAEVGRGGDVAHRLELGVGQRPGRAGLERPVRALERADGLLGLAVGAHLLDRRAQALRAHGRTRAGGPGATATASSGGVAPGGNRARTAPPNPPPMIRAPAAPAAASRSTVASTSGTETS